MKKRICICLLAALLCGNMIACGTAEETTAETTPTAETEETQTETETETEPETIPPLELPEKDYEGYVYRFLAQANPMVVEEQTGEVVNDAVYTANMQVAEAYNIGFEIIEVQENAYDQPMRVKRYILVGEDGYDVALLHDCATANMALNGYFHNVHELPHVDTSAVWWPQFIVDSFTLNHKMYYYSNYTSPNSLKATTLTYFNKDLLKDFGLEDPYTLVWEDKWTLDKMAEMAKSVYVDTNGNGETDMGDTLGWGHAWGTYAWVEGFGVETYVKEGPDSANMTFEIGENAYTLIEKWHNFLYDGSEGILDFSGTKEENVELFTSGDTLLQINTLGDLLPSLTDSNVAYGFLPFPKVDEVQNDYLGPCTDALFSVPITAGDLERTGIIVEAMSYAGYEHIMPAYKESALKSRYAQDEESSKVLELVFENRVISFAYVLSYVNSNFNAAQRGLLTTAENMTLASYIQERTNEEEAVIAKVAKFYGEEK